MRAGLPAPDEATSGGQERLALPDTERGFPLDGILADSKSRQDAVLDLEIPQAQVVGRIGGRRLCRQDRERMSLSGSAH